MARKKKKSEPQIDAIFATLSNDAIVNAFKRIISNDLPNQRIIDPSNRYIDNTINVINKDFKRRPKTKKYNEITEYIASSVICHFTDSWNFFSKAIISALNGDYNTAIHLAYYSELRTAMSIMASEGVGIFNTKHLWFDTSQKLNVLGPRNPRVGTHDAADYLVNKWAEQHVNKDTFFNKIYVGTFKISDWITAAGYSPRGPLSRKLLKHWLKEWSIDLKFVNDQQVRNETSYRPKLFRNGFDAKKAAQNISMIWKACEPTTEGKFSLLDMHLLRKVLEVIYKYKHPGLVLNGSASSVKFITDIYAALGVTPNIQMVNFLSKSIDPNDHFIISEAPKNTFNSVTREHDASPIICRAYLLLRLNTALISDFLSRCTTHANATLLLNFWWKSLFKSNGTLNDINEYDDVADIYSEVIQVINGVDFNSADWASLKSSKEANPDLYHTIPQFERNIIWGL